MLEYILKGLSQAGVYKRGVSPFYPLTLFTEPRHRLFLFTIKILYFGLYRAAQAGIKPEKQ